MARFLSFLHTSPVHIQTFNTLLAELAPDIPARHVVDESLLRDACAAGEVTPALHKRVEETLLAAVALDDAVVVCTCSSIGAVAEEVNARVATTVMRVDRAMAVEAVARGTRVVVAATLSSTLNPTRELIYSAARQAQKEVQVSELLCDAAWRHFESGDQAAYLRVVADQLQQVATQCDVIVLAQASMARAVELCTELPVPVLTSPRSGLLAAIEEYRNVC